MAFDDLSVAERDLIADLVGRLASGDFASQFAITPLGEARRSIELKGIGGAADATIVVSEIGSIETLREAGYLSMALSGSSGIAELSARAYEEYKSLDSDPVVFGLIPVANNISRFDDRLLERIAKRSESLMVDLRKNFALYRRQASLSFIWTLVVSTVAMILLSSGIAMSLIGRASTVNMASVSGILTEFLAAIFFRQAAAARSSQDRCQENLLRRQQILDLVELTRLISDEKTRDTVTQDLIKAFVLGTRHGKGLQPKE